ncbi:hypothetical protein ACFWR9_16120 [Streptomyces sp. NPDC058534]|uniref:hypothetical protein n=1 Tax=Streptomyces sp. NPDC058534 TaxID=3346541 RepID=UPI003659CCBB
MRVEWKSDAVNRHEVLDLTGFTLRWRLEENGTTGAGVLPAHRLGPQSVRLLLTSGEEPDFR